MLYKRSWLGPCVRLKQSATIRDENKVEKDGTIGATEFIYFFKVIQKPGKRIQKQLLLETSEYSTDTKTKRVLVET